MSEDWQCALDFLVTHSEKSSSGVVNFDGVIQTRKRALQHLFQLKANLKSDRDIWLASLHPRERNVVGHINVPLLRNLAKYFNFRDESILDQLSTGHPIVGDVDVGGNLTHKLVNADLSVSDLADSALSRQHAIIKRVRLWASRTAPATIEAGYKKTLSEFCVSFSDGESTPIVGAALWFRDENDQLRCIKTRCLAPTEIPGLWSFEITTAEHIKDVETFGPLLLFCTFRDILRGSFLVHYIDNGGALSCIVNVHSNGAKIGHAMSTFAVEFWYRAAEATFFPWMHYVPSALNIMDGYSRGQAFDQDPFGNLAKWSNPKLPPGWNVKLSQHDE